MAVHKAGGTAGGEIEAVIAMVKSSGPSGVARTGIIDCWRCLKGENTLQKLPEMLFERIHV